jgi:polyhydroxybutyrate depolymerase
MRRTPALFLFAVVALVAVAACSSGAASSPTTGGTATSSTVIEATTDAPTTAPTVPPTTAPSAPDPTRPYDVIVPASYVAGTPMPLVILLHGFGFDGSVQSGYFGMEPQAQARGFLFVHPDGTKNQIDRRFWNATDACCGFGSKVNDVGYLTSIIDQVSEKYSVDPKRVFLIGHSNGAFMTYRMACDRADRIAAIASLAGDTWLDPSKCAPSQHVSVLQVQGTADETISYTGGEILGNKFPGAEQSAATWAKYDGCGTATTTGATFDYEATLAGKETITKTYAGCPKGVDVALWTMQGAGHIPNIAVGTGAPPLISAMLDFLFAHPKP